uniref:DNA-directed DNA polymerase n=1 Tax=Tanacetum cinerariifolium TaxID=118510 RepID=A0A6L2LS05_TANCI|nr:DNA-directed DNA polymerase [Tanacetum cinerariifolium]
MAETMEQMSKTQVDYESRIVRPKIDYKNSFELKGQYLKELHDNTFRGLNYEDANEHIEKVLEIVDIFHILNITQDQILDSKSVIPSKTVADAKVAIQEMAEYLQKWHNGTSRTRSNETSYGLAAIQAQLNNLGREIKKVNKKVYAAQVGCEQCKGPHYNKDFPLKEEGKTIQEAYYTQFGRPFQGGRYKAAAPGFYQRNNANLSYQERRQSMEETLSKFMSESAKRHEENSNMIKEIRALTDADVCNQGALIQTLEIQIRQISKVLQERGFGSLPSSTEANPRDHVMSISTNVEADSNLIHRANVSVMPLSTYLNLGLGELTHIKLTVELADRTVKYPKGIAKNVLVGIGKLVFSVDFIILDMPEDVKVPLILRRPFLSTAHAKIDVFKRKITLRVGDEKIIFKSVKPASSLIKRVNMLSFRDSIELDLEDRLMGETLVLNRSLDPLYKDYIELNDLNVPLDLRSDQVDDLMPTIEEGEKFFCCNSFCSSRKYGCLPRSRHGDIILGEPFCKASCVKAKRFTRRHLEIKRNKAQVFTHIYKKRMKSQAIKSPSDEPMWDADRVVALTLGSVITIPETENKFAIKGNIIKIFYHGLSKITQEALNATAGGIFLYKTPNQACHLLKDKALLKLDWAKNQKTKSSLKKTIAFVDEGSSNSDADKIMARMDAMTIKMDAQYKELQSRAKQSIPDHDDDDMPMSREEEAKFMQTFSENMLIRVGKFTFLIESVILEMEKDSKVPLILGRPFLHIVDAVIQVKQKQLNLGVGTERKIFNIDSAMKHSYSYDDTCFSIDVIDEILKEDFDALLDEGSKILHSIEGTLLEEEFFFKFMAMTADENSESESDNEEPTFKKITINTDYKIKTSLEEPPKDLELKPLPDNLEYVFLEEPSFLPVIISSKLSAQNKSKLVSVLKNIRKLSLRKRQTFLKGGITVVTNENDELVPTRTVTGWRVCIDYHKLNEAAAKDHFPLPFMDQMRMPFGLCNAPATFQICMLAIFYDMIEESVEVFLDDFSVFGDSFDKCLNNLDKILQRCKDAHLVLNWEKCHFMVKEGIVLGHKVSSAGLEVDKAKINVISKLSSPTNIKVIMEYLVKISKKACILELKQIHLKITVLTSNTPYPLRNIRRIYAYTSQKTMKKTMKETRSIRRLRKKYRLSLKNDILPRDK